MRVFVYLLVSLSAVGCSKKTEPAGSGVATQENAALVGMFNRSIESTLRGLPAPGAASFEAYLRGVGSAENACRMGKQNDKRNLGSLRIVGAGGAADDVSFGGCSPGITMLRAELRAGRVVRALTDGAERSGAPGEMQPMPATLVSALMNHDRALHPTAYGPTAEQRKAQNDDAWTKTDDVGLKDPKCVEYLSKGGTCAAKNDAAKAMFETNQKTLAAQPDPSAQRALCSASLLGLAAFGCN